MGLGKLIVKKFADLGAKITILDIKRGDLKEASTQIQ